MNEIEKIQFDLLMVLLENDIIDDTHSISEREQVNTLEDVANEMIIEYNSLVSEAKTRKERALHLRNVHIAELDRIRKENKRLRSKVKKLSLACVTNRREQLIAVLKTVKGVKIPDTDEQIEYLVDKYSD